MKRTEKEIIQDALDHLGVMSDHAARGELSDSLVLDAVCLRLASAIEALSALPVSRRDDLFGDEWGVIWGTRNRIAHAYVILDPAVIAATLRNDVPLLVDRLEAALSDAAPSDNDD